MGEFSIRRVFRLASLPLGSLPRPDRMGHNGDYGAPRRVKVLRAIEQAGSESEWSDQWRDGHVDTYTNGQTTGRMNG